MSPNFSSFLDYIFYLSNNYGNHYLFNQILIDLPHQKVYFLKLVLRNFFLETRIQVIKCFVRFHDYFFQKSLLSTSKKLLTKILNLLFQEMTMIQLILLYNKFQTTSMSCMYFWIIKNVKSLVSEVYHIDLLKISLFYLCYGFLIHSNFRMILIIIKM